MKEVNKTIAFAIESEPGDLTHYSYFIIPKGFDEFAVVPNKSTFNYPQRINLHEAKAVAQGGIETAISCTPPNINPHTLLEVCRSVVELFDV